MTKDTLLPPKPKALQRNMPGAVGASCWPRSTKQSASNTTGGNY
jgi:hypothetical protein